MKLSVVIATLGGDFLEKTIFKINSGAVVPDEILVCIPNQEAESVNFSIDNVRILKTDFRGQVAQRCYGFKHAQGQYVLQIDDDILLDENCIEELLSIVTSNDSCSVAPGMINIETGLSVYSREKYASFFERFYYYLMNGRDGFQPGKVDKCGAGMGVDINECTDELIKAEWLPGGCVMHRNKNLIIENFYPFSGKAFGEDVIHSHCLKNNGVSLFISKKALCTLEIIGSTDYTFKQLIKMLSADYKVKKYIQSLRNERNIRPCLFCIFSFLSYCLKRVKKLLKS